MRDPVIKVLLHCRFQPRLSYLVPFKPIKVHLQARSLREHSRTMASTDSILQGKYPAKAHCAKVAAYLKEKAPDDGPSRIYLQGQKTLMIEDNDEPQPFRSGSLPYFVPHFQKYLRLTSN